MSDTEQVRTPAAAAPAIANPLPLGIGAFALTTFLLSAKNAGWTHGTDAWLGYAFAYGGLCQLLAGMWEFRKNNVFGATAFGTYGGFWIGLAIYSLAVAPAPTAPGAQTLEFNDLGWILMAFAIFNFYMLLWSTQVNLAVFAVFLTLQATEILLVIGFLSSSENIIKIGGYVGIVTAICAWYASAAGVINDMTGRGVLTVGKPLAARRPAVETGATPHTQ